MADAVVPLLLTDQAVPARDIIILTCLIVAGRLQPEVLKKALRNLVDKWPRLGSRLVRNKQVCVRDLNQRNQTHYRALYQGLLECHVPTTFSDDQPAFAYSFEQHNGPMPNIPQRSAISQPQLLTIIDHFRSTTSPRTASDLLNKDIPIMSLHITQFSDVTCVGLSLPHAVVDVMGFGIIMRAWCSIIADDHAKVPSLIVGDPFADYGPPYPSTRSGVKALRASMISTARVWGLRGKIRYFGRLILELALSPKEHCGLFFIPKSVVDRIREDGMREAKERGKGGGWVSENDVITAILVKVSIILIFLCFLGV